MKKIVVFAFQGDLMCFAHTLLNTIDLKEKGHEVKLVIEGNATALIGKLNQPGEPFSQQYARIKKDGLLAGVCKACTTKMGTLAEAEKQGLTLLGEMFGHPAFSTWLADGYEVISM